MKGLKEKLRKIYYVTGYSIVVFIMRSLQYKVIKYWTEVPEDITELTKWKFHLEFIR